MKILFNFCTNTKGGALKNALQFIKHSKEYFHCSTFYLLDASQLELLPVDTIDSLHCCIVDKNPAYSIISKFKILLFIKEKKIDIIYTMAGPNYFPTPCISILGLSNPYITHCFFSEYRKWTSFMKSLQLSLHINLQKLYSLFSNYYIFQTQFSKFKYLKYNIFLSKNSSLVISNAYAGIDIAPIVQNKSLFDFNNTLYIFCPGSFYPHKNFHVILKASEYLSKIDQDKSYKFLLTFSSSDFYDSNFSQNDNIINLGNMPYDEFISIYSQVDLVFLPSYLETFSSVYIESMYLNKILLLDDNKISRENCQDGAFYCDSSNSKIVADKIHELLNNSIPDNYFNDQQKVLSKYPTQLQRFKIIMNNIRFIFDHEKTNII